MKLRFRITRNQLLNGNNIKFLFASLALIYFLGQRATAQQWNALGPGLIGLNCNPISEILLDGTMLYAIGSFENAGGIPDADYIARWDGDRWHAVGDSLNGGIQVATIHDGQIYIAGNFTNAGGHPDADYFAKWDGQSWQPLGITIDEEPGFWAMEVYNNEVYVGGVFTDLGGNPDADYLAKWDGSSWQAIGQGIDYWVFSIAFHNGELYAGGFFENAGGNPDADFFARWDGHEWHGYPGFPGGFNRDVWDFVVRDAQDIYTTGAHLLNHWDGTSWHNYDPSIWGAGQTIEAGQGDIYVGTYQAILRWDINAQSWDTFPALHGSCRDIEFTATDMYAAGGFFNANDNPHADHIARWGKPGNTLVISGVPNLVCHGDPPVPLPVNQSGISGSWSGQGIMQDTFYPSLADSFNLLKFSPGPGQIFDEPVTFDISVFDSVPFPLIGYPKVMCPSDEPFNLVQYVCRPSIAGYWTGAGTTPYAFDPAGLNGLMTITFNPDFTLTSWDFPYQPLNLGQCIVPPTHTVDVVDLSSVTTQVSCFDNNTPAISADDYLVIEITPQGQHADTSYSVSVSSGNINPQKGNYNTTTLFQMQPGSAGGGDFFLTLKDPRVPHCEIQLEIQDPGPCSMVGLHDQDDDLFKSIRVFPNPTNHSIYIKGIQDINKDCSAVVTGTNGDIMLAYPVIPNEIDMNEWPSGMYYLKMNCGEIEDVRKIIRL